MSKKGILVLRKDGVDKACYCHRNAQLRALGSRVVRFCRENTPETLKKIYDGITLVQEESPMTPAQQEAYRRYMPEETWKDSFDWTYALKYTGNIVEPIRDGFPYMVDYLTFIPGWRCRWQYYIDLDRETLDIYKHGLEILCAETDVIGEDKSMYPGLIERVLVGSFPLNDIPEDWLALCERNYRKKKLILVDIDEEHEKGG